MKKSAFHRRRRCCESLIFWSDGKKVFHEILFRVLRNIFHFSSSLNSRIHTQIQNKVLV